MKKKMPDGGKLKAPIYTSNPNDPALKAYQDSLNAYDLSQQYNNAFDKLTTANKTNNFVVPSRVLIDNLDNAAEKINNYKGPIKFKSSIHNGTVHYENKKPTQPIVYQRNQSSPNLNLAGINTSPVGIGFNSQFYSTPNITPLRKNSGDPVYAIGGENSPLLGYYNNGQFQASDENPNAKQYTDNQEYMQGLIKRNYGTDYKQAEYKDGGMLKTKKWGGKMKKCDDGATLRQPFTFPYTQEEVEQIQKQGAQPASQPSEQYAGNLPQGMQYGFNQGYQQTHPEITPLQSAPITPLTNPTTAPKINTEPIAGVGSSGPSKGSSMPGIMGMVSQAAGTIGQVFSGAIAAIPALTSLIPDQRNRKHIRPEMEAAYTQNQYGSNDTNLYADGGMLGFHTQSRKTNGFDVTEEVPNFLPNPQQNQTNNYQAQSPINYNPYPAPIAPKKITYEHLHSGNDPNNMDVYSPIFNGNWSKGEMKNAFTNGTIPSNYNGVPTVNYSNFQDMWNGTNPDSNSYQIYPSNGQEIQRNNMIDITQNMGKNAPKPYYNYMKDGGTLTAGTTVELTPFERMQMEKRGYKFK